MPKNTLIKCIVNGKEPKFFNFEALTGEFFSRLLKLPNIKSIEVSDPNLQEKLSEDEFNVLATRFEYLKSKVRKPEPLPLEELVVIEGDVTAGNAPLTIEIKEVSVLELKPKQTRKKRTTNAN
jgi:hypothetical protein